MKKYHLIFVLGGLNCLYSLGLLIESFKAEVDEYGTSIGSNRNYLIWFISSLIILAIGFFCFKEEVEKK